MGTRGMGRRPRRPRLADSTVERLKERMEPEDTGVGDVVRRLLEGGDGR